ncbi:MAG: Dihydropteroate synthase [Opitutia bacterium UBA7350]|nr:MAG: Dihydropteroate synthase [Opitutae bacterium UBA7350]
MTADKTFHTRRKDLPLGQQTHFAGILNLTPDSFSDGGDFNHMAAAKAHFHSMVREGAVIIDIGGESTRPGFEPVSELEELERVIPFIESIREETDVLISVDTSKSAVAAAALTAGADIINDIWGAQGDPAMAGVIGSAKAGCILMHNRPAEAAGVGDVVAGILDFWEASVARVLEAGVGAGSILLDPGLGFGKTYEENWEIMRQLKELQTAGYPLLLGASRKSMLARLLQIEDPKARLSGTLGTTACAIQSGVDFLRVHDVRENRECADVLNYCLYGTNDKN